MAVRLRALDSGASNKHGTCGAKGVHGSDQAHPETDVVIGGVIRLHRTAMRMSLYSQPGETLQGMDHVPVPGLQHIELDACDD